MQHSRVTDTSREMFTALRDQLVENTLIYWENKPVTPATRRGITRGVEFARQCRSLHDFERKWVSRQVQGLGLMDAWSIFASDQPRPNPLAESETVMRIYKCLLYAAGAEQEYTAFEQEFAVTAITEAAIRKAKKNAIPQLPR